MATFPSLTDKKKDKDWHKRYVQAIVKDTMNATYDQFNVASSTLYDYYNGTQAGDEYDFLQTSEDGDVLPAKWINYNRIRTKINLLLGEMDEKGFEIVAKTINAESKVRKQEEKRNLLTQVRVNKDLAQLETGLALPVSDPNLPEDEEEVEDYFAYEYKDIYETIMAQAVKYCAEFYKMRHLRIELMRDLSIVGRCFVKSEIIGDMPILRRVDPRNIVFDPTCEDPFLGDCTYFGEVRYMSIADAAEQYGLNAKDLKKAYDDRGKNSSMAHRHVQSVAGSGSAEPYRMEGDELKVMVFSAVWQDTKPFNYKESKDSYGNEHVKFLGEKEEKDKKDSKVTKKNIKIWRKGTIVGEDNCVDYGEVENLPRSIDNIALTTSPYIGVLANWVNQKTVSIVEQLKGLQDLKNIALYNIQLSMARAGAKGFVYDVAQIPTDWEPETVMRYLKTAGIAFIDSKKDGTPSSFNQFSSIDLSLSSSIQYYIEISRMVDAEMDSVSGISEAREGNIQYASQTVGVTQSALLQSNLKTKTLQTFFEGFMTDCLNHQAGLVKIAWENKEIFAPIIGDVGVDFLAQEVDVDLQDYAMFMEYVPTILRDKDSLQNLILASMQQGEVSIIDAIKIIREKDTVMAVKKLEKAAMRKAKQLAAQEEARMQQQMQMQQEAQQAQAQAMEQQSQSETQKEMLMAQYDRETELMKAKINLYKFRR
jgi:hypothetical protein